MIIKIRLGFVTNSSSTNHIIMWKGKKADLRKLLEAHEDKFPTSYRGYEGSCQTTSDKIITAICDMLDNATTTTEYKEDINHNIEWRQTYIEKCGNDKSTIDWIAENLKEDNKRLAEVDNYDWQLTVGFGDNHGDYCGGSLGYIMDYEGRYIYIKNDKIYYTTEQER